MNPVCRTQPPFMWITPKPQLLLICGLAAKINSTYLPLFIIVFLSLFSMGSSAGEERKISIYLDADRTGTRASGISIEQGVRTALDEVGNRLGSYHVDIKVRNHHGSSPRSRVNLEEYLEDDSALVVFSGLHSPPLLENLSFINNNKILVLDPWAAAGPITRPQSKENWVFRLSIDDSKAGKVISKEAVSREGFRKPFLLLEDTGWGSSNLKTMSGALSSLQVKPLGVTRFNWSLGLNAAKIILRKISNSGADVIFLVANAPEGKTFARAMLSLPVEERLPIRSHWGITGGDFPEAISKIQRAELDLAFIQTRFSFINHTERLIAQRVLERAKKIFPDEISRAEDIRAPAGFVHAYDLTRILISAVNQVELTGDIKKDRLLVHSALESLKQPVEGLIKTYNKPFHQYATDKPDAHEALGEEDFTMGYYGDSDEIILRVAGK